MSQPLPEHLAPATFVDSDHPQVIAYAKAHTEPDQSPTEKAAALFKAVRDGFRYNPYVLHFGEDDMKASSVLGRTEGHCVDKANVYAAVCRAVGIPSRLHFVNVRNHIGTSRLEEFLQSNVLVYHGYAEVWLEGKWRIATPAFNRELCEHLGVAPLEFDGINDALFQEYAAPDESGKERRFMEYLHDHGHFADLPREDFLTAIRAYYGHLFNSEGLKEAGMKVVW
jgi:transglutaminase-like putative cysteine protease